MRIEDIDTGRCRAEYVRQIYDDLAWLGLDWPDSAANPVRVQSQHFDDYQVASRQLSDMGLLYPCFCTRKQVVASSEGAIDPDGAARYGGVCKCLSVGSVEKRRKSGETYALRLHLDKAIAYLMKAGKADVLAQCGQYADLAEWGDVVLVRKDTPTSYHLSVVVDDAKQNVTYVMRGMDMQASTAIHILLQGLLNLPTPTYEHHGLIKDDTGRKLAKSLRDRSIKAMREEGVSLVEVKRAIEALVEGE